LAQTQCSRDIYFFNYSEIKIHSFKKKSKLTLFFKGYFSITKRYFHKMKRIIVAFFLLISSTCFAANEQWINSTGSGKTYEEAKNNALRNALELAFGAFISSNTVIRNDIMIKDEIVSISSGNIKKYKELTKSVINGEYSVTLQVLVSPEKLASFVQSNGMSVQYQGESFATNMRLQSMNEKSEKQAIAALVNYSELVFSQCFDYTIKASDPEEYMTDAWEIYVGLRVSKNSNFDKLLDHIIKTLNAISLNQTDLETRKAMGKYPCDFKAYIIQYNGERETLSFLLRSCESKNMLISLFSDRLRKEIQSVKIVADAGRFSPWLDKQLIFADENNYYFGFKTPNGKIAACSTVNNDDNGYISLNFSKYTDENEGFASYGYSIYIKGKGAGGTIEAADVIGCIKGFRVIK